MLIDTSVVQRRRQVADARRTTHINVPVCIGRDLATTLARATMARMSSAPRFFASKAMHRPRLRLSARPRRLVCSSTRAATTLTRRSCAIIVGDGTPKYSPRVVPWRCATTFSAARSRGAFPYLSELRVSLYLPLSEPSRMPISRSHVLYRRPLSHASINYPRQPPAPATGITCALINSINRPRVLCGGWHEMLTPHLNVERKKVSAYFFQPIRRQNIDQCDVHSREQAILLQ